MTEEQQLKYQALCHAMQTGVATDHAQGSNDGSPKHLRVGINSAMVEHSALIRLLVRKGLFSDEEYAEALIEAMQEEVTRYEMMLSERTGARIKLA